MSDGDFTPDDPLPALRAQLDQAVAHAPALAEAARSVFTSFTAAGFTDRQALYLTAVQLHGTPGTAP